MRGGGVKNLDQPINTLNLPRAKGLDCRQDGCMIDPEVGWVADVRADGMFKSS